MKAIASFVTFLAITVTGQTLSAAEISSLYTKLDLKKCRLVASNPNEGGWAEFSCKGHNGISVRVAEGDLRYFVSFGPNAKNQVAATQTLGPFNTIHHTLEWRVEKQGKAWVPFATILRYFWDSGDGRKGQTLIVTKLEGNEACQVAHVKADGNPNANVEARRIADTTARAFDCASSTLMRHQP